MGSRIIFVPGKNLKPEPDLHRRFLWRSLLRGVERVQPAVAAEMQDRPETFFLAPWNHLFYRRHGLLDSDIPWINRLIQSDGPTAAERREAASWRKTLIKLMYAAGDRFHGLIKWLPDPRVKEMIYDTAPYFDNRDNVANAIRHIVKQLICQATGSSERVLLIGHSMGAVIAYEALWQLTHVDKRPCQVELFLTLGSPLGMRYVQKRLLGQEERTKTYPAGIARWENVSAVGDLISLDQTMRDHFAPMVAQGAVKSIRDHCGDVYNWFRNDSGLNVHRSYGYLVNPVVGRLVADWWSGAHRKRSPTIVAHRGYPAKYPENTLLGFERAIAAGARYIELDVQLTKDKVPIVYHDADTLRMSGISGALFDLTLSEIKQLEAYFPQRFGDAYRGTPVAALHEFVSFVEQWPQVRSFVEIKPESIDYFGIESVVDQVMAIIGPISHRCVVISFHDAAIEYARSAHGARIGWVLPEWSERTEARARALAPDFIFVYAERVPAQSARIWSGPWQWAVYVVDNADQALAYQSNGIQYIETDQVGEMLIDPRLQDG